MDNPTVVSLFKEHSYKDIFGKIPVMGLPVDLFLECSCYDFEAEVYVKRRHELDIFEESVLKLINLRPFKCAELADMLCLETDFTECILDSLRDKGYLKDKYTVSDAGKDLLGYDNSSGSETECIQGRIFVIKNTNLILPYIQISSSDEIGGYCKGNYIEIKYGTAGNPVNVKGEIISFKRPNDNLAEIKAETIRKRIYLFNKIAEHRNLPVIPIIENSFVSISRSADNTYFHVQAVNQEGNADYTIFSDGFDCNLRELCEYVKDNKPKLITKIRTKSAETVYSAGRGKQSLKGKYSKTKECLAAARQKFDSIKNITNIDQQKNFNSAAQDIIIALFHALEWGLYDYISENPISQQMLQLIKARTLDENGKFLYKFSKEKGFYIDEENISFLSNIKHKIDNAVFRSDKNPDLKTYLPLSLYEASENPESKIYNLLDKHKDYIKFAITLDKNTAGARHKSGNSEKFESNIQHKKIEYSLSKTESILKILLPDFVLGEEMPSETVSASQQRLSGLAAMELAFGSEYFINLPEGVKNDWIKISPEKKGNLLPSPVGFITILCRIVQTGLTEANNKLINKLCKTKIDALTALKKRLKTNNIPKSFSSVKDKFYENAANGIENTTLGAVALSFIANTDDALFKTLIKKQFLEKIGKIIDLRGHSSMQAYDETEDSLCSIRDSVIDILKTIGDYYVR